MEQRSSLHTPVVPAGVKAESPAGTASAVTGLEPSRIRRVSPRSRQTAESGWKGWKWAFPLGIGLAGLASAAAVLLRGCWHRNMSWPVRVPDEHGDFSYQSCNDCGIMRLFDERVFRGYGPYGYDLHALIAHEHLRRRQRMQKAAQQESSVRKTAPPRPPE
jgi:hypothetical protein